MCRQKAACKHKRRDTRARSVGCFRSLKDFAMFLLCFQKFVGEATDRAGEIESATTAVTALPL
jgi:hypothetical protein